MPVFDRSTILRRQRQLISDFEDPNIPQQYPPDLELEPVHLDIDLQINVPSKTAAGVVTTTVRARRDDPTEIMLDAVDFLDLEASSPEGEEIDFTYDGSKIAVRWAKPFKANEARRVAIRYRIEEPVDGLMFSGPDEKYPDRPLYAATDHETERARHWLPCIDLPNVRTTLDFHLRSDANFTILANGYLVEERNHDDGTKTAHWKLEQLCPSYLVCFAAGDFVRADDGIFDNNGGQPIEIAYFSSRRHTPEMLLGSFGRTGAMMAWMTEKLAMPFPYPKYYQFALPMMGGAMENISLVSWSDRLVADEEMEKEAGWWIDLINVHEMAHSYFGDAVVCRDFAHAWLKESWATFMEQCWSEDTVGEDQGKYIFYDSAHSYFDEADEHYMRPIVTRRFKSSWQLYDRHLYPGGACRLHTLRQELGHDLFWVAVRDYLQRYYGQVVETDHFRHVMEEHSGRSLGKFFDQWFHSPGYPDLKVSFKYDSKRKLGTFEVEQKQVDVEKGIPAFELSTDLGWTINGKEFRLPVRIKDNKHVFAVSMETEPEQVRFDPDSKVLHKLNFNPGDPMLQRQMKEAVDVIGRILAVHELAKTGRRANIRAIVDAYDDEPFWGVREQMVKALAKAGTESAITGLVQILGSETDPKLFGAIFRAAGEYRDKRLVKALSGRLESDLPPISRGAAYQSMGAQRSEARWDLLMAGSQQAGHNDVAQSGAFAALAKTRRDEAVTHLLDWVEYGIHSDGARPAIAAALGDIGQGLEKAKRERVVERLQDLLRDPEYWVRARAAAGLVNMKATESIQALESFAQTLSHQDRVRAEKQIAALRDQDKVDGSALKKQVEELREQIRKLQDEVHTLAAKVEPKEAEENSS